MSVHPFLDHGGPIAFAHRGGAESHPENTERAFRHAVELGFTHVETDVHVTADGVAIAFHDSVLDRVTDRRGVIAELPWSEVRRARVNGTEEILRLDELFDAFPDTHVNLDPKHDAAVRPLADAVRSAGAVDRVCVGSFSDRRIDQVRALLGESLCVSAGPRRTAALVARGARMPLPVRGVHAAQVPVSYGRVPVVRRRFVETAHRLGIHVHVWTVDDPDEMERLLDLGVDGIMTDRPAVLRDVFVRRGLWPAG